MLMFEVPANNCSVMLRTIPGLNQFLQKIKYMYHAQGHNAVSPSEARTSDPLCQKNILDNSLHLTP